MPLQLTDFNESFCFTKTNDTHPVSYQYVPEQDSKMMGRIYADWIYQGFVFIDDRSYVTLHTVIAGVPLAALMDLSLYNKIEPVKIKPKQP